jgi:hypothetical protein
MATPLVWTFNSHDLAVVSLRDLPVVLMHQPVMSMAQKYEVVEITRPAMYPMNKVMSIAP